MPRFTFHLPGQAEPSEALQLPDEEAAFYQAVRRGRDLGRAEPALVVEVRDEAGLPVWSIPLIEICGEA